MNIFTDGARDFGRYPFSIYGKQVLRILTYVIPMAWFQYYPFYLSLVGWSSHCGRSLHYYASFGIPALLFWRFGLSKYVSTGS